MGRIAWCAVALGFGWPAASEGADRVVDDFEDVSAWVARPADGVSLALSADEGSSGKSLRLDFEFTGGGYAVARKLFDLELPDNYAFSFRVRGRAAPNHLEFKLGDDTGENVWWYVRRDVAFSDEWTTFVVKKRHISFAWGPRGGGHLERAAAIEFVITAGEGGAGTVWIDDFRLRELPPADAPLPKVVARASSGNVALAIDGNLASAWTTDAGDAEPWLELDFGRSREFGGCTIDWVREGAGAVRYVVEASDDREAWSVLRDVGEGNGGRDYVYAPEAEARFVRVRAAAGAGAWPPMREIAVQPLAWSATRNAFFEAIAADERRGTYPRGFSGEQAYWTVIGHADDAADAPEPREFLVGEDGAVEVGPHLVALEPFLFVGDSLITWADVDTAHDLDDENAHAPIVRWSVQRLTLTVVSSATAVEYRLRNDGAAPADVDLFLALRPFQVNPPSQTLNRVGGFVPIRALAYGPEGTQDLVVNGVRVLRPSRPPDGFGATPFDGGDIAADYLRHGRLPARQSVHDEFGAASGALRFSLTLPAGGREIVTMERVQKHAEHSSIEPHGVVELPPAAAAIEQSIASQLHYILINRAGPAIRPGARSYARSWIRDGALTSTALLRLGRSDAARDFLEWYAPHQYENGKIPCVVDDRGADPVPEHDSSGQFIHLVAEIYRYTGGTDLATRMWPRIARAVDYLDELRRQRRGDEYRGTEFFGILPPSISHEGYSAKPMHSYWDDFFALRGFRDAVFLADEIGLDGDATRIRATLAEFEVDLRASVAAAMRKHDIDYVPGCADLGDFDATSTTIAFDPTGAADILEPEWLERTFERYWEFFVARRDGAPWEAYTPYEIRNIGAFVRLGWRDRALELCEWFLADQRPPGWRQWPEVVRRDPREAKFLGDLPHTWVGSDFIRSALDLLAYEDRPNDALVVAGGVPLAWLANPGIAVHGLETPYGELSYRMTAAGDSIECTIEAHVDPPGGIVLRPPLGGPLRSVTINGEAAPADGDTVLVRELPARVVMRYDPR